MQRKSNFFFSVLGLATLMLVLMFLDASLSRRIDASGAGQRREIVKVLALSDLCLVTEARYTRHPSMADLHTPFQEHPLSLEHFPSGSFIAVPPQLSGNGGL